MKLFLLLFLIVNAFGKGCLNSAGSEVDWWVILKMPIALGGYSYEYCDSADDCKTMKLEKDKLRDKKEPLLLTVGQMDFKSTTQMNIVWNDQPSDSKRNAPATTAHAKGLLSAPITSENGFIINHSTPRFPLLDTNGQIKLELDSNAERNGQHFYCVSMKTEQINKAAIQLLNAKIYVQHNNDFDSWSKSDEKSEGFKTFETFQTRYKDILALAKPSASVASAGSRKRTKEDLEVFGKTDITSSKGITLKMYSKIPEGGGKDFYEHIAKDLEVPIATETWGNGGNELQDPNCNSRFYTVCNKKVKVIDGTEFMYTQDHSKYGVSQKTDLPYMCFSDINRSLTNYKRGGTAICIKNTNLWKYIFDSFIMVDSVEHCDFTDPAVISASGKKAKTEDTTSATSSAGAKK